MDKEPRTDSKTNPYVYPIEYFDAQVAFAQRLSEVTSRSLNLCLLKSTALHRRITGNAVQPEQPPELFLLAESLESQEEITQLLYEEYLTMPHSRYREPQIVEYGRHFGSFIVDYHPDTQVIQLHMHNRKRGPQSDFHADQVQNRREDMRQLFSHVQSNYPNAERVIMGTWTFYYNSFQRIFPTRFIEGLGPPETLSLRGDSLWGQFVDSRGFCNRERYEEFLSNVSKTESEEGLLSSFPLPVLFGSCEIDAFYREYDIGDE